MKILLIVATALVHFLFVVLMTGLHRFMGLGLPAGRNFIKTGQNVFFIQP